MLLQKGLNIFRYIAFLIFLQACSKNLPDIKWDFSNKEVIGEKPEKSETIKLDIYLDATTSMEGFAVSNSSIYSQFLDQLEASALSAWRNAEPQFFKFGEIIKPINRIEFLSAKNNLQFYKDKDIFKKTYIDSVVKRTDSKRLSVLITDLFQDEGDVNIMVERIKEKCFVRDVMVGIIGVKSDFKGKVYDVRNYQKGYDLESKERPFYALIFGNPYNMELLFEALKTKSFVKEDQFLIFSKYIIKSFEPTLIKTKDSKFVNKKAPRTEIKNSFDFSMKKEGKEAKFNLEININRNTRCADYLEKNIQALVFKKSIQDSKNIAVDSTLTNDVSIENIQRVGDKLTGTVLLKNDDPPGNYSYEVYLKVNQLNGFQTPQWIKAFSTEDPIPNTPSASKTYNLQKLTELLLIANASISPTYISKFFINIYKR